MDISSVLHPDLFTKKELLAGDFRSASPFPHVVIPNFLRESAARRLCDEFPPFEKGCNRGDDGFPGNKSTFAHLPKLGGVFEEVDAVLQSPSFLQLIGEITGIPGLLYDPEYVGGGTHENRSNQNMDVHVDFNRHPTKRWYRRLNLLLYLNPEWKEEWGGVLELHKDPRRPTEDEINSIPPMLNQCVLFETSERSWHGFKTIQSPVSRRSIAVYFYTLTSPRDAVGTHTTFYLGDPLPKEADIRECERLLNHRENHLQRLFDRDLELSKTAKKYLLGNLMRHGEVDSNTNSPLRRFLEKQDDLVNLFHEREIAFSEIVDSKDSFFVEAALKEREKREHDLSQR